MAPEVILNRGHDWGADHFSLGVLIYEMLAGATPFYKEGMQQMDLFRAIVKGSYTPPREASLAARSMMEGLLQTNPIRRLGSLAGGEDDIVEHPWLGDVDFETLRRMDVPAPFIPKIANPLDDSHFDDWSHLQDKSATTYPKLTAEQAQIFEKF